MENFTDRFKFKQIKRKLTLTKLPISIQRSKPNGNVGVNEPQADVLEMNCFLVEGNEAYASEAENPENS